MNTFKVKILREYRIVFEKGLVLWNPCAVTTSKYFFFLIRIHFVVVESNLKYSVDLRTIMCGGVTLFINFFQARDALRGYYRRVQILNGFFLRLEAP